MSAKSTSLYDVNPVDMVGQRYLPTGKLGFQDFSNEQRQGN